MRITKCAPFWGWQASANLKLILNLCRQHGTGRCIMHHLGLACHLDDRTLAEVE